MKKFLCLLAVIASGALFASSFTVNDDGSAAWQGKNLISNEQVLIMGEYHPITRIAPEITKHQVQGKQVVNRIGKDAKSMPFRRETALAADGNMIELALAGYVHAFKSGIQEGAKSYGYRFEMDASMFDGGTYEAIVGRSHKNQLKKGKFSLTRRFDPGKLRFLSLQKGDKKIAFDFDVEGVTTYSTPRWDVAVKDGKLVFSHGYSTRYQGGSFGAHAVIYEGTVKDYYNLHARKKYAYGNDFSVDRSYSFGAEKTGKQYIHIDDKPFTAKQKAGWVGLKDAEKVRFAPSGALYSAVRGKGNATFKVSALKSGIYFVTLNTAADKEAVGKFSVKVNGEEFFSDVEVPAGKLLSASMPIWIEKGVAEISFSGNWQVNTLLFQLLQTNFEDIKFRRGVWVSDDYEPNILAKNIYYKKHPGMAKDIAISDFAPHRPKVPAGYKFKLDRPVLQLEPTEKNQWRYNEIYISSGANKSKFDDFITDELKNRELDLIESYKGGVVLISGMLSRHTFPHHMDRVDQYITDFTRLAHQRGMKVFDHVDMPLLWNADSGFRVMCETTEQLQRNVNDLSVNRVYCINNPYRNKVFFDWAKNLVRKSDIDGMMVDEVTFFTENFCGCRHCRAKFTQDTGLTLSMDETDPALHNSTDLIWKAWILWRYKSIGDWWVEFRKAVSEVKKDFSTLLYTTHWGFSGRPGMPLWEGARAVDILGTEIMTRNVIASYRSVNAFRKMKTGLGDYYGIPVYGLVYPGTGCWNIAYFGWAINYMNRQTYWDKSQVKPEGAADYKSYPERLNLAKAYGLADTAVVCSRHSIMFPANMRTISEPLGVSEVLSDMNIMHDFIISDALTDQNRLKRFKTIYLVNDRCMTDEEIKGIREFAANGGTVYMSFHCGSADELGFGRKVWPFKDVFGYEIRNLKPPAQQLATRTTTGIKTPDGKLVTVPKTAFTRIFGKKGKNTQVIYQLMDRKNAIPCVMTAPFGKGKFVFSNIAWGAGVVEFDCGPGKPYNWKVKPELMRLARQVLALAKPQQMFVEFKSKPDQVLASVTGCDDKKVGKLAVVNLLNCGNARPADPKEPIPFTMSADRGKIAGNIVFTMQVPASNVEKVYGVTPDFAGKKAIAFKAAGKNSIEVTVPGSMLKTFLEVRVKLKK